MKILIEREQCGYGWVAFDDDAYDGPGSLIGHGKSQDEAYREFLMAWWDRGERYRTHELERLMTEEFPDEQWAELDPDRLRDDAIERESLR